MKPRIDYEKVAPAAVAAMSTLDSYVRQSGLESSLLDLVKLRASHINGCAYYIDYHSRDARKKGETEQKLYSVVVWRETTFFNDCERAALAWTEAVTLVSRDHVPNEVYQSARQHFNEKELVDLT